MPSRTSAEARDLLTKDLAAATDKAKPKAAVKGKKVDATAHETQSVGATSANARPAAKAMAVARRTASAKADAGDTSDKGASAAAASEASALASKTANRNVAAAFVAARQKMAPAGKVRLAERSNIHPVKGTVEVSDKKPKKTVDEERVVESGAADVRQADAVPETAAAPVASRMPAKPMAPPVASPVAKVAKPALPKGQGFKTHEYIVYPAHGVGQIVAIEEQVVAGYKLELFVISFIKDKMILKVPLPKITSVGMRKLAEAPVVKRALDTLTGRARVKRTMWSRRAQEYEAKINSGDLVAIAEVVRDLYRSDAQPEQSYSERQLYEAALDRMGREIAVVQKLTDTEALKLIDDQLQKGPRRTKADEVEADEVEEADDTAGVGEAA